MIELLRRFGFTPRTAVWELTLACDMRCQHCGSVAGTPRADELSPAEAQDVACQLAALGCERITLSGGEPTLRKDWDAIGATLVRGGVRVNIISNGWGWKAEHTRRAQDAGLENAVFSVDGLQAAHDRVRARDGAHARVVKAIEVCVGQGLPVSVVSHINALNWQDLPRLREELGNLGVTEWQLQMGNPAGSMAAHPELVLDPRRILDIIPVVAEMRRDRSRLPHIHAGDNLGYFGKYEKDLREDGSRVCFWVGCRAGCQVLGIESNGNIKGCLSLPSARHGQDAFVEGNLRQEPLAVLWSKPGAFAYNREFTVEQLGGFCRSCPFADICRGGCSWTAQSRTGTRFDNPLCFYRQAVEQQRWDLLADGDPLADLAGAATGALALPKPMG